ncbi:MAG: hypothetical protein AB1801_26090 [Chloroflexota bacterium]
MERNGTIKRNSEELSELRRLNVELQTRNKEQEELIAELRDILAQVKEINNFLTMCVSCKKIRDKQDKWQSLETYLWEHFGIEVSHGFCPDCVQKFYPDYYTGH